MAMTKRETRVINAFLNCIKYGEYTEDYAITLIEDNARYGWMSDEAKDYFYEELDKMSSEEEPEEEPIEESEEEPEQENNEVQENAEDNEEPVEE